MLSPESTCLALLCVTRIAQCSPCGYCVYYRRVDNSPRASRRRHGELAAGLQQLQQIGVHSFLKLAQGAVITTEKIKFVASKTSSLAMRDGQIPAQHCKGTKSGVPLGKTIVARCSTVSAGGSTTRGLCCFSTHELSSAKENFLDEQRGEDGDAKYPRETPGIHANHQRLVVPRMFGLGLCEETQSWRYWVTTECLPTSRRGKKALYILNATRQEGRM